MNARVKVALASAGAVLFVCASCCVGMGVLSSLGALGSPNPRPAPNQGHAQREARLAEEQRLAEQANQRVADALQVRAEQASADLFRQNEELRAELEGIEADARARRWSEARAKLDSLAPRFEPVMNVEFTLSDDPSEHARVTVETVESLRTSFLERTKEVEGFENQLFNDLFEAVWGRDADHDADSDSAVRRVARRHRVSFQFATNLWASRQDEVVARLGARN